MSRFVFAGNEIIPGTVVMTADGTITPKDDLRVILNISGGGTVSLSDGTDTTQRIEIVNVNADPCSFTYKGTGGSTTASIYTNTGIRLLWVGSYWETSMSTAVTGIDDNSQPFAFNIDSLVKPDGVINLTGTDANGNPFDYGVGKLVVAADENTYNTSEQLTTKTWIDGKPIYRRVYRFQNRTFSQQDSSIMIDVLSDIDSIWFAEGSYCRMVYTGETTYYVSSYTFIDSANKLSLRLNYHRDGTVSSFTFSTTYLSGWTWDIVVVLEYTKTTD